MATRKKEDRLMYGQVPLPQLTKELAERQARKRQLRQPPTLAAVIPEINKEVLERQARKRQLRQPPALAEPLPQARAYRMFKVAWGGLNKTNEIDTGQLSDASNIDMGELPYIVPCLQPIEIGHEKIDVESVNGGYYPYQSGDVVNDADCHKNCKTPLGLWSSEDALVAIFSGQTQTENIKNDRGIVEILDIGDDLNGTVLLRGTIDDAAFDALAGRRNEIPPHMVANFNTYGDDPYNVTAVTVTKRLLVAPTFGSLPNVSGIKVLDWEVTRKPNPSVVIRRGTNTDYNYMFSGKYDGKIIRLIYAPNTDRIREYFWASVKNNYDNNGKLDSVTYTLYSTGEEVGIGEIPGAPLIDHMTVHQSRLFSVGNNRVYASGYNDYSNYDLDTAEEINEAHAWMSTSQSNPKAAGEFTAVATYGNHVLLFREKFLQEVYGNKNPFRIVDIGEFGTIDQRSICEINGVLYFVGNDAIYAYNGGMPRDIGSSLGINKFTYAAAGRCRYDYYLYCEDATNTGHLFVYNTRNRTWTEHSTEPFGDGESLGIPNSRIIGFANKSEGLYALTQGGRIYCVDNTNDTVLVSDESAMEQFSDVSWWFETEFITRHNLTSSSSAAAMAYSNVNIKHLKSIQLLADVAGSGIRSGSEQQIEADDFNSYATVDDLRAAWVPDSNPDRVVIGTGKDGTDALQLEPSASKPQVNVTHTFTSIYNDPVVVKFKLKWTHTATDTKHSPFVTVDLGNSSDTAGVLYGYMGFLYIGVLNENLTDRVPLLDRYGNHTSWYKDEWYDIEIIYDQQNKRIMVTATSSNGTKYTAERNVSNDSKYPAITSIDRIVVGSRRYMTNASIIVDDFNVSKAENYPEGRFKVYALYDGVQYDQSMTPVYDNNGRTGRLTARIKLRNTAHYGIKLHVQGTGYVKLHELELYVEDGGTPYLGTGDTAPDGSEWIE